MEAIGGLVLIWMIAEAVNWINNDRKRLSNPEDLQCPVCGYYCLGSGGVGCIDKPYWVERKNLTTPED